MIKKINQISEQAFLLDFGSEISKEINQSVINIFYYICNQIQKDNFLDLKNCTPSYNKILLQFNPAKKNKNEIFNFINTIDVTKVKSRIIMSPVHLKTLTKALQDNIRKYEEKFGEIVVKSDGKSPKFNLPEDVLPN